MTAESFRSGRYWRKLSLIFPPQIRSFTIKEKPPPRCVAVFPGTVDGSSLANSFHGISNEIQTSKTSPGQSGKFIFIFAAGLDPPRKHPAGDIYLSVSSRSPGNSPSQRERSGPPSNTLYFFAISNAGIEAPPRPVHPDTRSPQASLK
ncbi:hypothetical protein LCGC14_0954860 [marine sediment metagenome]|uniref:Uncharacterized protein n=1 Tax=marine sediment metagenome TaxID=412755 RepID=A0A0F9P2C3_9ZZZZ